jgi:hypothetical protein
MITQPSECNLVPDRKPKYAVWLFVDLKFLGLLQHDLWWRSTPLFTQVIERVFDEGVLKLAVDIHPNYYSIISAKLSEMNSTLSRYGELVTRNPDSHDTAVLLKTQYVKQWQDLNRAAKELVPSLGRLSSWAELGAAFGELIAYTLKQWLPPDSRFLRIKVDENLDYKAWQTLNRIKESNGVRLQLLRDYIDGVLYALMKIPNNERSHLKSLGCCWLDEGCPNRLQEMRRSVFKHMPRMFKGETDKMSAGEKDKYRYWAFLRYVYHQIGYGLDSFVNNDYSQWLTDSHVALQASVDRQTITSIIAGGEPVRTIRKNNIVKIHPEDALRIIAILSRLRDTISNKHYLTGVPPGPTNTLPEHVLLSCSGAKQRRLLEVLNGKEHGVRISDVLQYVYGTRSQGAGDALEKLKTRTNTYLAEKNRGFEITKRGEIYLLAPVT